MEELIIAGRITVNRMPADVGQKVGPGDEVRINGEPVKIRFAEPKPRVLIYHKPTGELVTRDDPEDRPTVFDDLPSIRDGKWIAVGRLDYNTEGLLLFTNSGELANRLMHPRYEVEREYAVRVMGRLSDEQTHALLTGVELEDGPAKCEKVEDGGGDEDSANHWYHVAIKEGRNREIRRLFEALGLAVSRLIRTRYGRVAMPSSVKRGEVLEMDSQDVNALLKSIGLKANAGPNAGGGGSDADPLDRPQGKPRPPGQGPSQRHAQRGRHRGPPGAGGPSQGNANRNAQGNANRNAQGGTTGHAQRAAHGNAPRPPHGNAQRPEHGQRPGQGGAKRRGQRQGQGFGAGNPQGSGGRRPPRYAQGEAQGNVLGAPQGQRARPGKPKRRTGRGAKPSSNVSAQVGVARDRRVGQTPRSANDGRAPSMPVVTHKKSRRSSLPPAEGGAPGTNGLPRDEEAS